MLHVFDTVGFTNLPLETLNFDGAVVGGVSRPCDVFLKLSNGKIFLVDVLFSLRDLSVNSGALLIELKVDVFGSFDVFLKVGDNSCLSLQLDFVILAQVRNGVVKGLSAVPHLGQLDLEGLILPVKRSMTVDLIAVGLDDTVVNGGNGSDRCTSAGLLFSTKFLW